VPDSAQPLLPPSEHLLLTSPQGLSPNRTLIPPNGLGVYTAYVCAVDEYGGRACATTTLTVAPACPGTSIDVGGVLSPNFTTALAVNDTLAVLEVGCCGGRIWTSRLAGLEAVMEAVYPGYVGGGLLWWQSLNLD